MPAAPDKRRVCLDFPKTLCDKWEEQGRREGFEHLAKFLKGIIYRDLGMNSK